MAYKPTRMDQISKIIEILKKNLDSIEVKTKPDLFTIPDHQNIRGANNYY